MTQDSAGIVERLRRKDAWTQQKPYYHERNPDGPEAAAHIEAQAGEIAKMRDMLRAVMSDTLGPLVGGGDGGTYVVRPISGETYNRIHAALKGAKP